MIINLSITFKTKAPLTQEQGKDLWAMAIHFGAVGPSTYRFQSLEAGTDLEGIQNDVLAYIRSKAGDDIEIVELKSARNEAAESLGKRVG